jgi:hypothetical protein
MGDIPGNPERRLPQGSPPPFAQNRSNMAIFKVEGGRRLRGEITVTSGRIKPYENKKSFFLLDFDLKIQLGGHGVISTRNITTIHAITTQSNL